MLAAYKSAMSVASYRSGPVNQHRGLAPRELKRRYHRRHDRAPEEDPWEYDGEFEPEDPRDCIFCGLRFDPDEELALAAWEERLRYAARRPRLRERLEAVPLPPAPAAAPATTPPAADLAEALRAHLRRTLSDPSALLRGEGFEAAREQLGAALAGPAAALLAERGRALSVAVLLWPFWLRPVAAWTAPSGADVDAALRSLIAHLFVRYPLPPFLLRAWSTHACYELKWACWTVLLGQGASLPRVAPRFGWTLQRAQLPHLLTAPEDLSPWEAALWIEVARHGGDRRELDLLWRNPAYRADPTGAALALDLEAPGCTCDLTAPPPEAAYRAFLGDTVRWMVRHRGALTEEGWDLILAWAAHRFTEAERGGAPFTLRGRSLRSAEEQARAYQREQRRPYQDLAWRGRGWDFELDEGDGRRWTLRELTSARELYEEGAAMAHCVGGYGHACASGWSAIFSLRLGGERRLTVELAPQGRRVVQARGRRNGPARPEEEAVLSRWLRWLAQGDAGAA